MAITKFEAAQLADMLSDDLTCENSRTRLLCVVELLRTLTDEEHRLSNSEIRMVLSAKFGDACAPAENTINSDLAALRDCGIMGLKLHTSASGNWLENTHLPASKVRLLVNAVQASRFLTQEQSFLLQEDLGNLVSRYQGDDLLGEVLVEQRTRTESEQVFEANDLIARAIREKRCIEFEYTYVGFDGKAHVLEGDDGNTVRIETPIGLIYSYNNYYMESYSSKPWRHGERIMLSRVDRMRNVRVSERRSERGKEATAAKRSAKRRMERSVEMVGGPMRTVFLRVSANMTNVVFDKFGYWLKFGHFDGRMGDVTTTAVTCIEVAESFTFFRWLSSAGSGIVLEYPQSEIWVQSGPWQKLTKEKPLDELRADYDAMRSGFLAYLDKARAPYL